MAYYEDIGDIDSKIKCFLCETYISDSNAIDLHLNGDHHMELYIKRIMIRNMIVMKESKPHCLICNNNLYNLEMHIKGTEHTQKMYEINKMVERDGAFLEFPTKPSQKLSVHCTICNCYVGISVKDIRDHLQSQNHRRSRSIAAQPFNGIFSVEGTEDSLWCKICQLYFENYVEVIFQHIDEDEQHVSTLNKILRLIEGQNIMIDKYLTNANEDKATCQKCGIEVPCNADNLERHVKGKRHQNA